MSKKSPKHTMGTVLSRTTAEADRDFTDSVKQNFDNFYHFFTDSGEDDPIFEDVFIQILSHVPPSDLIFNCRLVCKRWRSLIDAQSIWRLKCERENCKLPSRKLPSLPKHHYRYIYLHSISKKNLLKNPCGESRLNGWSVDLESATFKIENPPVGADPVPEEVGSQSCFATTFEDCQKSQLVNLIQNPVSKYLLRNDLAKIKVGEWYVARFDCASEYELKVDVYDEDMAVLDSFNFKFEEEQWCGRKWHFVSHEFDLVTSACYVGFYHRGKDRQFWAGYYGCKMTGGFVELCIK